MSNRLQEGIADILLPAVPAEPFVQAYLYLQVTTVLFVMAWLLSRYFFSKRVRAIRRLRHDARSLYRDTDHTLLVYNIAAIVRDFIDTRRLDCSTALPYALSGDAHRWQRFISEVNLGRYTHEKFTEERIANLVVEAEYWLRRWR